MQRRHDIVRDALRELGWIDGRDVRLEYRSSMNAEQNRAVVAEIAALSPSVILTGTAPVLAAAHRQTKTVPIVFIQVTDPVSDGFVESLARPGGNVTGFTIFEHSFAGKWLEMLKEVVPAMTRVAVMQNSDHPAWNAYLNAIREVASRMAVEVTPAPVRNADEVEAALAAFGQQPNGGVILLPSPLVTTNRELIAALTLRYRLPSIYVVRLYPASGGLMSYGMDTFAQVREATARIMDEVPAIMKLIASAAPDAIAPLSPAAAPDMRLGHFLSMCDDTGLFQHAVHSVPDRAHGYCVDDNARALLLACALNGPGEHPLPEILTARFAAFVQHAWNPDTRRFRNFMGFNRTWLEDQGSEDSHGRTLWALGECARKDASRSRRRWAAALFAEALSTAAAFRSPRAMAFTLLGLDAYCAAAPDDQRAREIRHALADTLVSALALVETPDWVWFEEVLAYDNARLPQALIATGLATQTPAYVDAGLRTLRWLMTLQTTSTGHFRPVGTTSFGELRKPPGAFDQQPVEATATIAACLTAWRADGDAEWKATAAEVFFWFFGGNDLSVPLVDAETGSCRDGLHPDRANENRGGESVVSYLLALADMRQLARANINPTNPVALRAIGA
jgi:ABC-type uncharacterized transport system substrate-binding protein